MPVPAGVDPMELVVGAATVIIVVLSLMLFSRN
jgi:hypothetical protein